MFMYVNRNDLKQDNVAREEFVTDDPVFGIMIQCPGLPNKHSMCEMKIRLLLCRPFYRIASMQCTAT